ncbi:MAG: hypothetical protein R2882_06690 [Gemmatimonadales bacterium]
MADPIVTVPGRREQVTFTGLYRPANGSGDWFVEGGVDLIRTETGTLTSGRLGGAIQYRELHCCRVRQRGQGAGPARRTTFEVNGYLLPAPEAWDRFSAPPPADFSSRRNRRSACLP